MSRRLTCIFLLFLFFSLEGSGQSCKIIAENTKGCAPQPIQFDVNPAGKPGPFQYLWDFGDSTTSSQKDPNHTYTKRGKFQVKLTVKFGDGSICTDLLSYPVVIFGNPSAQFNYKPDQQIILCNSSQKVCFKDNSKRSADNAPIVKYLWTFGDGGLDSVKNPCYHYNDTGTYQVILKVTDTNGCGSIIQSRIRVKFGSAVGGQMNPEFHTTMIFDCKKQSAVVTLNNFTDTTGNNLRSFVWAYGDGQRDSCQFSDTACVKRWLSVRHTYTKTDLYSISLTLINKYGCEETYTKDTFIFIEPYKLDIKIFPAETTCFSTDSIIYFDAPYHVYASYYYWDFGDKRRPGIGRTPGTSHTYSSPGVYKVHYQVKISNCLFDTCLTIKILGPKAKIMQKSFNLAPWDTIPSKGSWLLPLSDYPRFFDTTCIGPSVVDYYRYAKKIIPNGDTLFNYCNTDSVGFYYDSVSNCQGKFDLVNKTLFKPKVVSTKDKTVDSSWVESWVKGTPFPGGNIYTKPPFKDDPLRMNDTAIFRCTVPERLKFTNFSWKYRGYDAWDNFPPGLHDTCRNPYYPFASDSLNYLWDFGEGTPVIADKSKPDVRAQYSRLRIPTHLYQKGGCYFVRLTVNDPLTGCEDHDSIPVVLQQADAGWGPEFSSINNMTWAQQLKIGKGYGRRGMILSGRPCVADTQHLILDETLPSCYKPDFLVTFDSARSVIKCNGKPTGQWKFYTKKEIEQKLQYVYSYQKGDTGWKTMGLVMKTNDNCVDTVWYHNYKYFHSIFAGIRLKQYHVCVGGVLALTSSVPAQDGIKRLKVRYSIIGANMFDTLAGPLTDSFPTGIVTSNGFKESVVSTVHRPDWGMNDSVTFNHLYDTLKKTINAPGHIRIHSVIESRFGCLDSVDIEATSGHYADFNVLNTTLCTGDSLVFPARVQYFLPFSQSPDGLDHTDYWQNPDSARKGRKPKIAEQMSWDLDGDGKVDATGNLPVFTYKKPGVYSVRLFTKDSLGCTQTLEKKNYIHVVGIDANFTADSPGLIRYCAPHFIHFRDHSKMITAPSDSNIHVYAWYWDFGDTSSLFTTDVLKKDPTHLYMRNGKYVVTLKVFTNPGIGLSGNGCTAVFVDTVFIKGPRSKFAILGPHSGCVPFTLTVLNFSDRSSTTEWLLGDKTSHTSHTEDTVQLVYRKPGTFCPSMIISDTLTDLTGKHLFCTDTFPYIKCQFKVTVFDTNKISLIPSDTIICLGKAAGFTIKPDTGYSSWTLNYGDGSSETKKKPPVFSHTYGQTGYYTIKATGQNGRCPDSAAIKIRVIDVLADFDLDTMKNDTPSFTFVNKSVNGVKFKWDFGDGTPPLSLNSMRPVSHEFQKSGTVRICLTAYNVRNCPSTLCKEVSIYTDLFIPNVFTPDGDAYNNHFDIFIRGDLEYHLKIFNRWGELVFQSDDKNIDWDGNDKDGNPYPAGTYYYVFTYRLIGASQKTARGTVSLIR